MARLPLLNSDTDQWGAILNEFLRVSHREDGTLRGTCEVVNVRDFGADPTGVTDSTAAIQQALNAGTGGVVVFPKGTYLADGLTMGDGTAVIGYGATIKGRNGTTSALLALGNRCRVSNLALDGNRAHRPDKNDWEGIGFLVSWVSDAEVINCAITRCARVGIQINNSDRYFVGACRVTACGTFGINVVNARQGRIADNYVSECVNNIEWWGGNAGGDPNAPLGVTHLTITGNVSLNATTGIWGSRGAYVTVAGNTVEDMADIGIDFEGCLHCTASGNTVKNCVNGGLTVFYASKHIAITGNSIDQDAGYGSGFHIHGSGVSQYISFVGNTVRCANTGAIMSDLAVGSDILIQNNQLTSEGGGIIVLLREISRVNLSGNQARGVGDGGIWVEGGCDCIVADNRIETTAMAATAGDDVGGIHLYWRSPAFPGQRNTVHGNIVVGFRYAINDNCWGNQTSHNWIYQNRLNSGVYRRAGTGYAGRIEHNVSQANPNQEIVPTSY